MSVLPAIRKGFLHGNHIVAKTVSVSWNPRFIPTVNYKTLKRTHSVFTCKSDLRVINSKSPTILNFSTNSHEEEAEEDDNDRALKELDIMLLKPHPEWRNVAAGPVWGKGNEFYDLLWKSWLEKPTIQVLKEMHDLEWANYTEEHGFTPEEYLFTKDFVDLYEGQLTWANYFRKGKGTFQKQKTRKTCIVSGYKMRYILVTCIASEESKALQSFLKHNIRIAHVIETSFSREKE
ncbi:unnamed protein product [Clavelina lepadiformis]|uniref:Uncharacterized protein n=1 Tax=Clavelina lepadiformis TaxID=159417 RepID=A0ABP0F4U0_CLALP